MLPYFSHYEHRAIVKEMSLVLRNSMTWLHPSGLMWGIAREESVIVFISQCLPAEGNGLILYVTPVSTD